MVEPNNIDEISNAIQKLRDDKVKRERLSLGALETTRNLTIERRAFNIISFLKKHITE